MDIRGLFQKKPKALDSQEPPQDDGLADVMTANDAVKRKQMMLLGGAGCVALLFGSMYIFSGDEGEKDVAQAVEGVSTDEMVTKNCLLYTSDAADERSSVDLGGRRTI